MNSRWAREVELHTSVRLFLACCWGLIEFLRGTFWFGTGLGYTHTDTGPGEGPDKNELAPGTNPHKLTESKRYHNKHISINDP